MSLPGFPSRVNDDRLGAAYADFLCRYSWDLFGTHTYRSQRVGFEGIVRSIRGWIYGCCADRAVELGLAWRDPSTGKYRGTWPNAYRRKTPSAHPVYVVGVERHKSGVMHAHTLIKLPSKLPGMRRTAMWQAWWNMHGFGRFEPPREQQDVASYVSKYVCKEGSELYFSPSFTASKLVCA